MKEKFSIPLFVLIGLGLAYFASGPLRRPKMDQPLVGTPINGASGRAEHASEPASVYAEGTISVSKSAEVRAQNAQALFIIARTGPGGPPLAVKRIAPVPLFPFEFSLTEKDNMMGDGFYNGEISLIARIDHDGAVGPMQPQDVESKIIIGMGDSRKVKIVIGQ